MTDSFLENWQVQIKKGYIEFCILQLLHPKEKLYGLQLIKLLEQAGISVKEGTLYPLLSKLNNSGIVKAFWDLKNIKGHPRKFYKLTTIGENLRKEMEKSFSSMFGLSTKLKGKNYE